MLSSSDAKWRCMWIMFVWSIQLTLVSQFLDIANHVVFFILAGVSIIVLPILTSIYSNTSGRHGAGMLRAGLVFCDPILACLTITPVLLLNHVPSLVDQYYCFTHTSSWNTTYSCIENKTEKEVDIDGVHTEEERHEAIGLMKHKFRVIQASIVVPILMALLMGSRSRKMSINTYMFTFAYWFIVSIELADLLETAFMGDVYKHTIFTTEAMISIVMLLTNTYAVVTLCSFITPAGLATGERYNHKFDILYKLIVGISAVLFCEIPLVVARFQLLVIDTYGLLPGIFYLWLVKDVIFVGLIMVIVYIQKFGNQCLRMPCKPTFDNKEVHFQPEKRDMYIVQHQQEKLIEKGKLEKHDVDDVKTVSEVVGASSKSSAANTKKSAIKKKQSVEKAQAQHSKNRGDVKAQKQNVENVKNNNKESEKEGKGKEEKRVTFKFDVGKGKHIKMKARSNSPPVLCDKNDVSSV